jgi:hypothetical protein
MSRHLLRFGDLKEQGIVRNWPQLRRLVETQGFPQGFYLSANTRVWDDSAVEEWLANRPITREQQSESAAA